MSNAQRRSCYIMMEIISFSIILFLLYRIGGLNHKYESIIIILATLTMSYFTFQRTLFSVNTALQDIQCEPELPFNKYEA